MHGIVCCDMVAVHADLYVPLGVSNIVSIVLFTYVYIYYIYVCVYYLHLHLYLS